MLTRAAKPLFQGNSFEILSTEFKVKHFGKERESFLAGKCKVLPDLIQDAVVQPMELLLTETSRDFKKHSVRSKFFVAKNKTSNKIVFHLLLSGIADRARLSLQKRRRLNYIFCKQINLPGCQAADDQASPLLL